MNHFVIDNLSVKIVKSKRRKTMAIKVIEQAVSIHIPEQLPLLIAENFVINKTDWIKQKLNQQSQRPIIEKQFVDGEQFQYLARNYTLKFKEASGAIMVSLEPDTIICQGNARYFGRDSIRHALIKWYQTQATRYLTQRTHEIAEQTRLNYGDIVVKNYKARWGSCNARGDIQYNWKLIIAPATIIDYVIVHELCHTRHHNHSKMFWQLVEQFYPDFKAARQWLKVNAYQLTI